jgi:hypothetical protein
LFPRVLEGEEVPRQSKRQWLPLESQENSHEKSFPANKRLENWGSKVHRCSPLPAMLPYRDHTHFPKPGQGFEPAFPPGLLA